MTSIIDMDHWRARTSLRSDTRRDGTRPPARPKTTTIADAAATTFKTIRIACALALIIAFEIGDSCL